MRHPEYLGLEESATFRENYRLYAAIKGRSVTAVATKLGMRENALCQILTGKRHVMLETDLARKIARTIGVSMEHMITEQLLYLDPAIKTYLGKEENVMRLYALMEYTETGNLEELLRNLMDAKKKKLNKMIKQTLIQ